ncbi:MAG: hypothetical protein EBZ14_11825 [Gammaproteobacteria bacterium]|nr:hypothetical protein [Gammaproteobacteria bacterium]
MATAKVRAVNISGVATASDSAKLYTLPTLPRSNERYAANGLCPKASIMSAPITNPTSPASKDSTIGSICFFKDLDANMNRLNNETRGAGAPLVRSHSIEGKP